MAYPTGITKNQMRLPELVLDFCSMRYGERDYRTPEQKHDHLMHHRREEAKPMKMESSTTASRPIGMYSSAHAHVFEIPEAPPEHEDGPTVNIEVRHTKGGLDRANRALGAMRMIAARARKGTPWPECGKGEPEALLAEYRLELRVEDNSSGRLLGIPTVIVMPHDAPAAKLAATRAYQDGQPGSEVVIYDRYTEDREAISRRLALERGMTLVPPFDHPHVIAGQGTAAKELFEEVPDLDYLFVCVGGGGLLAGSLLAAEALAPQCRVVGVEPAAGNDGQQSFKAGHVVQIPTPHTIADGAQTQALGQLNFPIIQRLADDMVTATDEQLVESLRFFAERMKIVVEPTGALAFAGAQHGNVDIHGARVGILISGGNVDLARYARFLSD